MDSFFDNILQIDTRAGTFLIRPVEPEDAPFLRDLIIDTLGEYGATGGGFASSDSDTRDMYAAFQREGRRYYAVAKMEDQRLKTKDVVGGGGIAPLPGEPGTCELVKMYFRPGIRGLGLGKRLLSHCLDAARALGYRRIYLETLQNMHEARGLYEHLGFRQIPGPCGQTGHFGCDTFYARDL